MGRWQIYTNQPSTVCVRARKPNAMPTSSVPCLPAQRYAYQSSATLYTYQPSAMLTNPVFGEWVIELLPLVSTHHILFNAEKTKTLKKPVTEDKENKRPNAKSQLPGIQVLSQLCFKYFNMVIVNFNKVIVDLTWW